MISLFDILILLLASIPPLCIDLFIPSREILETLGGYSVESQGLVAIFFSLSFACSQFLSGFLIDRFGAKRVLFSFISLMLVSTLLMSLAETFQHFLFLRAFQGFGAGVGPVLSQVLIKGQSKDDEVRGRLAFIGSFVALVPIWSPIVGEWLAGTQNFLLFVTPIVLYALFILLMGRKVEVKGNAIAESGNLKRYLGATFFLNNLLSAFCFSYLFSLITNVDQLQAVLFSHIFSKPGYLFICNAICIFLAGFTLSRFPAFIQRVYDYSHFLLILFLGVILFSLKIDLTALLLSAIFAGTFLTGTMSFHYRAQALNAFKDSHGITSSIVSSSRFFVAGIYTWSFSRLGLNGAQMMALSLMIILVLKGILYLKENHSPRVILTNTN